MLDQGFTAGTLHQLRVAVLAHARAAGMPENRATDVMLAVHELAANAIRHGGGTGRLRIRVAAGALHCQVTDPGLARCNGNPPAAAAGQPPQSSIPPDPAPWPHRLGHGLWLVQRTADQFTAVTGPLGSQVTVWFALPSTSYENPADQATDASWRGNAADR
jgi:anti-sigma regulatory factor (Ser/Thr protein kinase)